MNRREIILRTLPIPVALYCMAHGSSRRIRAGLWNVAVPLDRRVQGYKISSQGYKWQ